MQFIDETKRAPTESIVPMINVVFLLLIFFLMTAQIAPREPFPVAPPTADADEQADGPFVVFVNADGDVAYQDSTGELAALAALAHALEQACVVDDCDGADLPVVLLRADANAPAALIAGLMPKLGDIGFKTTHLITGPK